MAVLSGQVVPMTMSAKYGGANPPKCDKMNVIKCLSNLNRHELANPTLLLCSPKENTNNETKTWTITNPKFFPTL